MPMSISVPARTGMLAIAMSAMSAMLGLSGCASSDAQRYAAERPALDLRQYFNGELEGHGMVLDRSGTVTRRFVVRIDARWENGVGTLDERFQWSDGGTERRVWTLQPGPGAGEWRGSAADVIGTARGRVAGNALHWTYTLAYRTPAGKVYELDFDDSMLLIDERVMLNRAVMRFWGFRVGEVLISFRPLAPDAA